VLSVRPDPAPGSLDQLAYRSRYKSEVYAHLKTSPTSISTLSPPGLSLSTAETSPAAQFAAVGSHHLAIRKPKRCLEVGRADGDPLIRYVPVLHAAIPAPFGPLGNHQRPSSPPAPLLSSCTASHSPPSQWSMPLLTCKLSIAAEQSVSHLTPPLKATSMAKANSAP
jgi:hypothetical protein